MDAAAGAQDAAAKFAAKILMAKELRDEDIRLGLEQTRKNLAVESFASGGGSESDDHGSNDGFSLEVAAEDNPEASREATHFVMEEIKKEKKRKQREEDVAVKAAYSSV